MRKVIFITVVMAIFLLSNLCLSYAYEKEIKSISSIIAESITKSGKKTIAVVDFTDLQGNITELGRFLAEELSVDLTTEAKGFEVIDRTHLKSILTEHKLSISGLADPNTVKKLGQIAGVDAIITGSVTPFGDTIRLSAKVIATDTAKLIGAAKGDIAKTKAIEELLARGIETSQPSGQQAPATYVPSAGSQQSKKIGDITITVKKIAILKGKVEVALDLFNHLEQKLKFGFDYYVEPNLSDEKGNILKHKGNIPVFCDTSDALTLNPKSNNDVMLYFEPQYRDINIKDIGSVFKLSFKYCLFNPMDRSKSIYNVLFTDIKAEMPK